MSLAARIDAFVRCCQGVLRIESIARIAIIMNGSPLFSGDAGSGESEIRRFIFENDWLEALVALPERLFYNTGIATYFLN